MTTDPEVSDRPANSEIRPSGATQSSPSRASVISGAGLGLFVLLVVLKLVLNRGLPKAADHYDRSMQQSEAVQRAADQQLTAALETVETWPLLYSLHGKYTVSFPAAEGLQLQVSTRDVRPEGIQTHETVARSPDGSIEMVAGYADWPQGDDVALAKLAEAAASAAPDRSTVRTESIGLPFPARYVYFRTNDGKTVWLQVMIRDGRYFFAQTITPVDRESLARHFHTHYRPADPDVVASVEQQVPPSMRPLLGEYLQLSERAAPTGSAK